MKKTLIKKWESTGFKQINDPTAFIEYSNDTHDIYKNIDEYNSNKERKIFIVFYDIITDMLSYKKLNPIVTVGMRRRNEVSFRCHIDRDVVEIAETSSWRCNWYVNVTAYLWRLCDASLVRR